MNRMFSIIFFSSLYAILQVRNTLIGMLAYALYKPAVAKQAVQREMSQGVGG